MNIRSAVLCVEALIALGLTAMSAETVLIPRGASWKYLDTGVFPGATWKDKTFDDSAWKSGNAEFGYGDGDEATVVSFGPNPSSKYITTYFRTSFTVVDPQSLAPLTLSILRDDGAVVYINGTEVYRTNMPSGAIGNTTLASTNVSLGDETEFIRTPSPSNFLTAGVNVIAVEVHQMSASTSDLSFNLSLIAGDSASFTWSNAAGMANWTNAANWAQNVVPLSSADTVLTFPSIGTAYSAANDFSLNNPTGSFTLNQLVLSNNVDGNTISGRPIFFKGTSPALTVSGAGSFTISAPIQYSNTGALVVNGSGTGDLTLSSVSGVYLTKTSPGTLTITGDTYLLYWTVSNGSLVMNGAMLSNSGSTTTVGTSGTLRGTGTVQTATVNGTVAPGTTAAPGTLSGLQANFSSGGKLLVRIPGPGAWDQLNMSALTFGGTSKLVVDLAGYTSAMPSGLYAVASASSLGGAIDLQVVNNATGKQVSMVVSGGTTSTISIGVGVDASAPAANWVGPVTGGSWNDPANWSINAVPGPANDVIFPATMTTAVLTLDANQQCKNITLNSVQDGSLTINPGGPYALSTYGNSLTYDSTNGVIITIAADIKLLSTGTFSFISKHQYRPQTMNLLGVISGNMSVKVTGDLIKFGGANTFGPSKLTISATLSVSSDANLGNAQNTIEYSSGEILATESFELTRNSYNYNNVKFTVNEHKTLTIRGVLGGDAFYPSKYGLGVLYLTNTCSSTSSFDVWQGTLRLKGDTATLAGGFYISNEAIVEIDSSGTADIQNFNDGISLAGGTYRFNGPATSARTEHYTGFHIYKPGSTIELNPLGNQIAHVFADSFISEYDATVNFVRNPNGYGNLYAGPQGTGFTSATPTPWLTVNGKPSAYIPPTAAQLTTASQTGFVEVSGKTTRQNGNWDDPNTWTALAVPASTDDVSIRHTVTLANSAGAADVSRTARTLSFDAGGGALVPLNSATPGVLTVTLIAVSGNFDAFVGTGVNFGSQGYVHHHGDSGTLTISGAINTTNANVGLVKSGPGTVLLSGTNNYPGGTYIHAGTLLVTGTLNMSQCFVGSGTTLGGTGTVYSVSLSGTIAPGMPNATGTLTVTDALYPAGAILIRIRGTAPGSYDVLDLKASTVAPASSALFIADLSTLPTGTNADLTVCQFGNFSSSARFIPSIINNTGNVSPAIITQDATPGSSSVHVKLGNGAQSISFTPVQLSSMFAGTQFSTSLVGANGNGPYNFQVTAGTLPAGLVLSPDGLISGKPTAGGPYNFTVFATDSSPAPGPLTGIQSYTGTVFPPTNLTFEPRPIPSPKCAVPYTQVLTGSGGTAPYSFAIAAGALPPGLTLSANGQITGTPSAGGQYTVTITVTDSSTGTGPYSSAEILNIVVLPPTIWLQPPTLPDGAYGSPYSQTLTASDGTAPYMFALASGSLPTGLNLSADGSLAGIPLATGQFAFSIVATDSSAGTGPYTATLDYQLAVTKGSSNTAAANAATAYTGADTSATLNATVTTALGNATGGTVVFQVKDGETLIGAPVTSAEIVNGAASVQYIIPGSTPLGIYTIEVTYSGDATVLGSSDVAHTLALHAPVLASAPTATPSVAGVGQLVSFSAAAIDAFGDTLAYAWSFGDGTTNAGVSVQHAYLETGNYTSTVTVSDGRGGIVTGSVEVQVRPALYGEGPDSDGDGFSDSLEIAAGSDPANAGSTLLGALPAAAAQTLNPVKLTVKLNFTKPDSDSLTLTGTLPVPPQFSFTGKIATVQISNYVKSFTLDAKGKSTPKGVATLSLAKPKNGVSKFSLKVTKSDLATAFAAAGLTPTAPPGTQVQIPVTVFFSTGVLQRTTTHTYTQKNGKTGSTRQLP